MLKLIAMMMHGSKISSILFCFEELFFENIRNSRTHVLNVHSVRSPFIFKSNSPNHSSICYLEEVINKHIPSLSTKAKALIKKVIEERLMIDPIGFGKPLRYSLKGHRRLRVSDYRIVYRIEPKIKTIFIVAIKHRKDIYKDDCS
ncbi:MULTISPECIES: type II toxin-antitoxin system RelE family toxin [unclassified Candidatus Tisiphia]|uniref:type II toxin-antitoxin system RelE family toxin n=1 Tax=unclassified Candidatus Tisiphia TaxID=2996318 RepID=UPI001E7BF84A|nr:MAG: type II toxin-antitoxin system RelE/ParE family toxin [Rickettsia endosymbiont of Cimex lectularius]